MKLILRGYLTLYCICNKIYTTPPQKNKKDICDNKICLKKKIYFIFSSCIGYLVNYFVSVAKSIKVFSIIPITGTITKNHAK